MSLKKYIRSHNLIICGSVDDGKSSLIGKLIFELNALYKDQVISLEQDTKKYSNLKSNRPFFNNGRINFRKRTRHNDRYSI